MSCSSFSLSSSYWIFFGFLGWMNFFFDTNFLGITSEQLESPLDSSLDSPDELNNSKSDSTDMSDSVSASSNASHWEYR